MMFKRIVRRLKDSHTPPTYLGDDERAYAVDDNPVTRILVNEDDDARSSRWPATNWSWLRSSFAQGLIAVALVVLIVLLHSPEWWLIKRIGLMFYLWATTWAPSHPTYAAAIIAFFLACLGISFLAHQFGKSRRTIGRAKLWIRITVFQFLIWFVFWYWTSGVTFRDVLGKGTSPMSLHDVLLADLLIVGFASAYFWIMEKIEDLRRRRVISQSKF